MLGFFWASRVIGVHAQRRLVFLNKISCKSPATWSVSACSSSLHRQDAKLETICLAFSPIVATEGGRRAWRRLDCVDSPAACKTAPWWSAWFSRCCRGPPASVSSNRMLRTWISKFWLTQARPQETVYRKAPAHTFHEIQGQMLSNLRFHKFIVVTAVRKFIKILTLWCFRQFGQKLLLCETTCSRLKKCHWRCTILRCRTCTNRTLSLKVYLKLDMLFLAVIRKLSLKTTHPETFVVWNRLKSLNFLKKTLEICKTIKSLPKKKPNK